MCFWLRRIQDRHPPKSAVVDYQPSPSMT